MEEMKDELLKGEDKLLQQIREAWEKRYAKHFEQLSSYHLNAGNSDDSLSDGSSDEARTVLREAVDLKARVKTEFEILQELRSEIEDSESVFDWKARFEKLDKENLHLRHKIEDMTKQVHDLERQRQTKDFEISNQRRYYDNRVEELERQIRRLSASPHFSPTPSTPQYSTPMTDKVRQYTALTVISDDEDDDFVPPKSPGRSLPATPLSASSPKPQPRTSSLSDRLADSVPLQDHQRVMEELREAKEEVSRLRTEMLNESRRPELTASIERLKEELYLVDGASQTELYVEEMSYSGLGSKIMEDESTSVMGMSSGPLFPLETVAGVIVEATLNNAVTTLRQMEEAVAKERNKSDYSLAEEDDRRKLLVDKFANCRQRLWQKVKKDDGLRQDLEDFESLLGMKTSSEDVNKSTESANSSVGNTTNDSKKKERRSWLALQWFLSGKRRSGKASDTRSLSKVSSQRSSRNASTKALVSGEKFRLLEEAETQTVCLACTELQAELVDRTQKQVDLMARIAMLEEELVESRNSAEERTKLHKDRENELEQHITKLRNLSVKDNEEIDSLIGELDALRQLLDTKQTEFQSRVEALNRASELKVEQIRLDCRKQVDDMQRDKDNEMQTIMKSHYGHQNSLTDKHEEEIKRIRREHAQELDMLDQKYQDEFVDLERHHTDAGVQTEGMEIQDEMLALKKDLEERFTRDVGRLMDDNTLEIESLREKLQEARTRAEALEQTVSDPADNRNQESELIAMDLMNQLIQYCSALEIKLSNACFEKQDSMKNGSSSIIKTSSTSHWKYLLRSAWLHTADEGLASFPLRSTSELQPALSESLEVLTELVNRVLGKLDATQQRSDTLQRRVESLDRNLDRCGTEAETEHQQLEVLHNEYQAQSEELRRAEALIRNYAEKEGELTKQIHELEVDCSRINGELETANSELDEYRHKEMAMDEERNQLQSVRDILSNSMNDSSRAERSHGGTMHTGSDGITAAQMNIIETFHRSVVESLVLFEANQSLQDEKCQLESEFGRRFEQLQARKTELEGQVEAMEMEMEQKEEMYKSKVDDLQARNEAMKKQMRSDTKFLEEQTRERETERDRFQSELEQMQNRVKDLTRDNASLRDLISSLSSAMPPGSPPSPLPPVPNLRERVKTLEDELEEERGAGDQLREQIDELMAENARLQIDLLQTRGSTDAEDEEDEDRASADSLEEIGEKLVKPKRRRGAQTRKQRFSELDEELARTRMMRELEGTLNRRRSEDAEARLDDAEGELRRMRHIHEVALMLDLYSLQESENDKAELQQQVCAQLGQLSALKQEVDSKRHLQPSQTMQSAAESSERIEELEMEVSRLRELLASRSDEVEKLEGDIKSLVEEKAKVETEFDELNARIAAVEVANNEVNSEAMSEFTQRLLTEKNDEIDGLQMRLSQLEESSFTDGERLGDAENSIHRLNTRLDDREGFIERLYNEMRDLKKKLQSMMKTESAAEVLRVSANGDGPMESSSDEEVCELNIPGSLEEDDVPTEVMVRQKKDQRRIDYKWAMNGILDEVDTMVDELKLELQKRDDEVDALRVQESTLEKEVQSLITFQNVFGQPVSKRQLQEDYDVVQNMLEESQQLRKDLEEFDPQLMKEEFEEKEAALLKELKEAQCLANEREEDLYVLREEKESLESTIEEFVAELTTLQDDVREKDASIARLQDRLQQLEQQRQPEEDMTASSKMFHGRSSEPPEQDSGVNFSVLLPSTPRVEQEREEERRREIQDLKDSLAEREREVEDLKDSLSERVGEVDELRGFVKERSNEIAVINEQLSRAETARERAATEASIERSERERLASEKERLERELSSLQTEANCQRARLNALLHGDEDLDALSSLQSLSPRRSPLHDEEELEVAAVTGLMSRRKEEETGGIPHQLQALLDRIHKEGVQLLSLSELQYLQTHATVIRHKLDSIRRESNLKSVQGSGSPSDPVIEGLQTAWRQEKQALISANDALKDLLSQLSQTNGLIPAELRVAHAMSHNRNNNSISPTHQDSDWRQEMIASVERAYKEERNMLLANMRSEVSSAQLSGTQSPEKRLWEVERRLEEAEMQQRSALERLYQSDRQSLIEEARSLRRRLHDTELQMREMQEKQVALTTSEMNNRHENSLRETELAAQLERLKMSFSKLHVDLESANRRLGDSESRILALNAERMDAVRRMEELEGELEERDTRICVLSEQLQQEAKRRQECMSLAEEEQQLHDRLRTQLDSERGRSARLEVELKEERSRAIDRARQVKVGEQELRCQLEAEHRRCADLESAIESERLRICSLQRELEGERSLRRSRESDVEARSSELTRLVEKERERADELKTELERERRQLRQTREALEEERTNRRQAAHVEADAQAGLVSQLESARTRVHHLESALDAERSRLRKLTPRAEEVANALERERAVTSRLQAELAQCKASRLESETRADRLQDCLRGLSEEHEAERRRWREQERRCSLELEAVSSRLHRSADAAHLSAVSRNSSTPIRHSWEHRRGGSVEQPVLGLASPVGDPHVNSVISSVCSSLLALENEVDVVRSADNSFPADLSSLSRHLRHLRQRMEDLSSPSASLYDEHVIRQNCELSRMVVQLAREKEELHAVVCRLEEGVADGLPDDRHRVPPDGRGPNGVETPEPRLPSINSGGSPFTVTPTPSDLGETTRTQRLYAKYLRSESKRRALVYQKRYLLLLLGGFRECEEAVLATIANMGVSTSSSLSHYRFPRPLMRFRAAARVVVATVRMQGMVRRWKKVEEAKNGLNASTVQPPPPVCPRPQSSPNLTSNSFVRPFRPDSLSWRHVPQSPTSPQNEDFMRRLERLQYRVDAFSSPKSYLSRYSSVR